MANATLLVRCPDRTGIIAALSDFVFRHGGNILDLDQHTEPRTDAEDVGDPSQEGAGSVRVREREPHARELEEGVGGEPRHRWGCVREQLIGALEGGGRFGEVPAPGVQGAPVEVGEQGLLVELGDALQVGQRPVILAGVVVSVRPARSQRKFVR